jgi:hypothetical protein
MAKNNSISHYGVKGMHWGVRRSREEIASGTTRVTQKKPGGKLVTQGGKGVPAHQDAIAAAQTKQVAKNSGTHALSNKELQQAVTRMNLENQYAKLQKKNAGQKFAEKLIKDPQYRDKKKKDLQPVADVVGAALSLRNDLSTVKLD